MESGRPNAAVTKISAQWVLMPLNLTRMEYTPTRIDTGGIIMMARLTERIHSLNFVCSRASG